MLGFMEEFLSREKFILPKEKIVILSGSPGGEANSVDFVQIYTFKWSFEFCFFSVLPF